MKLKLNYNKCLQFVLFSDAVAFPNQQQRSISSPAYVAFAHLLDTVFL